MKRRFFSGLWLIACAATACVPGAPVPPGTLLPPNFHVLEDGKAYRSGQPSGDQLRSAIDALGLRTVLNLRNSHPGTAWYDEEAAACGDTGVTLVSVPMSAQSLPPPEVLAKVVETLQTAEYPLLIHCQAGADRTGATSAIYRMIIDGWPREQALGELSPLYFHLRALAPCMDVLTEMYQPDPAWMEWYAANWQQLSCGAEGDAANEE